MRRASSAQWLREFRSVGAERQLRDLVCLERGCLGDTGGDRVVDERLVTHDGR